MVDKMTNKEFVDVILNIPAESQTVEFKRLSAIKNDVDRIVESVVALTNSDGGTVVLGVSDPSKVTANPYDRIYGIEENPANFDLLGREITRIIPPLGSIWPPQIIPVPEINKRIALLFIPKSIDNFHSINNHVYIRQERSNKLLTAHELIKFAYAKGFQKADREIVDIDFSLLKTSYYEDWKGSRKVTGSSIEEILEKTGLARKNDKGELKPTRAAVLLFAEFTSDLFDTKCTIRVFQYTGKLETIGETPNLIGTPKTISGPIIKLIKEAHEYVLTLLRTGIKIPSGFVTKYQVPERAVKESITNAVIHRDYFMKRDIEVKIFEDRIEIENPGLLPYNITPANIGYIRSDGYRNDLLVKHLREFPAPPNLDQNEGVRAISVEMKTNNLYPPIYWTYPHLSDAVRIILLNEKVASEWEKINHYLKKNKYITNEIAREITGVQQRDSMSQILKKWVDKGLLIQIKPSSGYLRATKYRLTDTSEITPHV